MGLANKYRQVQGEALGRGIAFVDIGSRAAAVTDAQSVSH